MVGNCCWAPGAQALLLVDSPLLPCSLPEDYVVPFPMPSACTWAWSPWRSGSSSAPRPSSSCSSPSCCWEGEPCPSSGLWTSRTPSHARGARRTSISARRRRWFVWGFVQSIAGVCWGVFQFRHFSGLVHDFLLKSKMKAVEKAR